MSTLQAFIAFASSEEESSKTLFYVVGGVAAVYAVVISAIGIRQPEFPRSESAARGVYAVSAAVVLAAMASAIITS